MGYLLDALEKYASTIRYDDKGNPMVSMYDDDSIPYIDNFEKNKRTIKRIGPGIAMAGLGVGLNDLKEKFPNSVVKNVPDKLSNGLMLGGTGLAAAGGAYNYIKERNRNKRIAAYDQEKTAALENYYDETDNAGGEFGWKVRGTETKEEQEKRLKTEAAHDAWVKKHQASKKYHALSAGLVAGGLYKGRKKQNLASLGLLSGGLAVGTATGIGNRNAYNKYQRTQADQEKTARSIDGWDLAEEERLGKLWNSPEYQKKQIDELRANYRKVGQKMPGDVNRRHRRMKIGALAVGGMAVGLGAQKLNRMYAQKKKRDQAEQEKTALLSDPDNLWKDQNKPPTLLNALKPKKPHGTTGAVPDYVKGTGRKQPSPLTDLINSRKRY